MKPVKIPAAMSLEDVSEAAEQSLYDGSAEQAGEGWGGPFDDDVALGEPVIGRISVGSPTIRDEDGEVPRRLRMRYYFDRLNKPALRSLGDSVDWRRIHTRQAVDLILFDDATEIEGRLVRTALISLRDATLLNAVPIPALASVLGVAFKEIQTSGLSESLDPDFFTWMLYQYNAKQPVGEGVSIASISEMHSRDRNLFGARFTEEATLERIEMAALIVMGDMRFGPGKFDLDVDEPSASFNVELNLDGGFTVMRTSAYKSRSVDPHLVGHALVEDMWSRVLPRVRDEYNRDNDWRKSGRIELRDLAVGAVRAILP